jgi:hypothetical protein
MCTRAWDRKLGYDDSNRKRVNRCVGRGPFRRHAAGGNLLMLHNCCLLLQYLIQSCARGRRVVEDVCIMVRQVCL